MILVQLVGGLLPVLNLVLERSDQTLHQSTVKERNEECGQKNEGTIYNYKTFSDNK